MSSYAQLAQFRYSPQSAAFSDQVILQRAEDVEVCALWDVALQAEEAVLLLASDSSALFFHAHNFTSRCELQDGCLPGSLPPAPPDAYEGSLQHLTRVGPANQTALEALDALDAQADAVLQTLRVGTREEMEEVVRQLPLERHYRRICFEGFEELAAERGFILANETVTRTIPFVVVSPLFEDMNSLGWRLLESETNVGYFTPFEQLSSGSTNDTNDTHHFFTKPVWRDIRCTVDLSLLASNPYYAQRLQSHTRHEGDVLVVDKEGVKELRYGISLADRPMASQLRIHLPRETLLARLEPMCERGEQAMKEVQEAGMDKPTFFALLSHHPESVDFTAPSMQRLLRAYLNITTLEQLYATFNETVARRLTDVSTANLLATEFLFRSRYGNQNRKVPAGIPHFLNRSVLATIEKELEEPILRTVAHRFTHESDLHFTFMYYWFVQKEEQKQKEAYYDGLWEKFIDTDHDGILSDNEVRTLAAILHSDNVNDECVLTKNVIRSNIRALLDCLVPAEESTETSSPTYHYSRVTRKRPLVTFNRYKACTDAVGGVESRFPYNIRFTEENDGTVTSYVEMATEDMALTGLNDARRRQTKFISLKDENVNATVRAEREKKRFFDALFPTPSLFELQGERLHEATPSKPLWLVALLLFLLGGFLVLWFCSVSSNKQLAVVTDPQCGLRSRSSRCATSRRGCVRSSPACPARTGHTPHRACFPHDRPPPAPAGILQTRPTTPQSPLPCLPDGGPAPSTPTGGLRLPTRGSAQRRQRCEC